MEALAEEHNALAIEAFGLEQYAMAAEARDPNPNLNPNLTLTLTLTLTSP